jgi:hypothetical protein
MKSRAIVLWILVLSIAVAPAQGGILDYKELAIDFTDSRDAAGKADWSERDKITVSEKGLGWDGEASSSRDGWIQTKPMAVGLSWRPPYAVSVRVTVRPLPTEIVLANGQKSTPYGGDVYVRYSADLKHWSSWQVLQQAEPQSHDDKQHPGRHFQGSVRIPYRERAEYSERLSEYSRLDVPWKSDEEAAARWLVEKEPDFFAKRIPLIGYVQFLFEGHFHGGQRIRSLKASVSCGIGGMHAAPKDPAARNGRDSIPWRFKADAEAEKKAESYIPKDLDDCFAQLQKLLKPEEIEKMRGGTEDDMVAYHLGLGMWMRNTWGLWAGSRLAAWFQAQGITHPDDMSGIILTSLWRHINRKPIRLDEQVKYYVDYWKKRKATRPAHPGD